MGRQLGYSVDAGARDTLGVLGLAISVTSAVASPAKLEARALRFLRGFVRWLGSGLRATAYAANVQAAVANRLIDDRNLGDESARLVAEIETEQYLFDRAELEAEAMRALSQAELATWARQVLLKDAGRLSVHAHRGSVGAPDEEPLPPGAAACEPHAFRAERDVFHRELQPLPATDTAAV